MGRACAEKRSNDSNRRNTRSFFIHPALGVFAPWRENNLCGILTASLAQCYAYSGMEAIVPLPGDKKENST